MNSSVTSLDSGLTGRGASPVLDSERARFENCFRAHHADVLAYALRRVNEQSDAEEVVAETFATAWRRRDVLPATPLPWLYGIARRVAANQLRGSRRRLRLADRLRREHAPDTQEFASIIGERAVLSSALTKLRVADREALLLSAWEGLSSREAAEAMGCSVSAYDVRLHRARKRLTKELAGAGQLQSEGSVSDTEKSLE